MRWSATYPLREWTEASELHKNETEGTLLQPTTDRHREVIDAPASLGLGPSSFINAFRAPADAWRLAALSGLPLLLAAWMLISPENIFSREMSLDLLFNLEGAWHLYSGHIPHVDFHDPLGTLNFALTELGFRIIGVGPQAFIVGVLIYAGFIFLTAICALSPRLPVGAAAVAVLYVTLLVLVPINIGDDPSIYTFAMAYNRFGWATLVLLFLLLSLPPAQGQHRLYRDPIIAVMLLTALFYLKITYFLVGIGATIAALVLSDHVRSAARSWRFALGAILVVAALPVNYPYWRDIWAAVMSGAVRNDALGVVKSLLIKGAETSLLLVQLLCLVWLWQSRHIRGRYLLIALFIAACGPVVLSQNAQTDGVPLDMVISFMLFTGLRKAWLHLPLRQHAGVLLLLVASLIPPAFAVASMSTSIAGYRTKATQTTGAVVVGETNLRGLVVPADSGDMIDAFTQGAVSPQLLVAAREQHPRWELTQAEYLKTVLEAAALFRGSADHPPHAAAPRIMTFDSIDPLPFMLGFTPPRGTSLWLDPVFPWPPAEKVLGDVDVILIPKFINGVTELALARYGEYLHRHFVAERETTSWVVYRRNDPAPPTPGRN